MDSIAAEARICAATCSARAVESAPGCARAARRARAAIEAGHTRAFAPPREAAETEREGTAASRAPEPRCERAAEATNASRAAAASEAARLAGAKARRSILESVGVGAGPCGGRAWSGQLRRRGWERVRWRLWRRRCPCAERKGRVSRGAGRSCALRPENDVPGAASCAVCALYGRAARQGAAFHGTRLHTFAAANIRCLDQLAEQSSVPLRARHRRQRARARAVALAQGRRARGLI